MCGLFGVISTKPLTAFHRDAFHYLTALSCTRGEDAIGVAIRRVGTAAGAPSVTHLIKAEGLPQALSSKFPGYFQVTEGRLFPPAYSQSDRMYMGHVRSKTRGALTVHNAHPFRCGHITGAHNGTLLGNYTKLPKPEGEGDTDSERVFQALSEGMSLEEIVTTAPGAYALTWWDSQKKTFNVARNSDRTLHYALHSDCLIYASEKWCLEASLRASKNSEFISSIKEFEVGTHYTVDLSQAKIELKTEEVPSLSYSSRTSYYDTGYGNYTITRRHPSPAASSTALTSSNVIHLGATPADKSKIVGINGLYEIKDLSKKEFDTAARMGCSYCCRTLVFEEYSHNKILWMDRDTPFCATCANEWTRADAASK